MPDVIVPPDPGANSVISLAEAEAYFETRLHTAAWDAASVADQEASLIMASRVLLVRVCLRSPINLGDPLVVVAEPVKWAAAELALVLLAGDASIQPAQVVQGLSRLKAGPVELAFRDDFVAPALPAHVLAMIPKAMLCPERPEFEFKVL